MFIRAVIEDVARPNKNTVFGDLFAGTGVVSRSYKRDVKKIIANDAEYYSYVLLRNYIGNNVAVDREHYIAELNSVSGKSGFISEEYSEYGKSNRKYFTKNNGEKIDSIRSEIELLYASKTINDDDYYFLLASLLESADRVANTASVYGAYLKKFKKTALAEMILKPAVYSITENKHDVYQSDANELIKNIEGDVLYLDPPYNSREYGANYHILNTIARYDNFTPKGKTGLREYNHSQYCQRKNASASLEQLVKDAKFKYIFLSYNNEGLITFEEIKSILSKYGRYDLEKRDYQRFKADNKRVHKANKTLEYLHILEKDG